MATVSCSREFGKSAIPVPTNGSSGPPAEDDDDVQFMFSAPKRKCRKRKRVSGLQSTRCGPPQLRSIMSGPAIAAKVEQRRASAGMVQQLESCHIGLDENTRLPARSGSLPAIPAIAGRSQSTQSDPSVQSKYLRPVYGSNIPDPTLTVPWDESSILSQPYISPNGWEPLQFENTSAKRQKSDKQASTFHSINHSQHYYQPSQISPKTVHSSLPTPLRHPSGGYETGFVDMLGSSAMQDMQDLTIPSDPMEVTWEDVSCEASPNIDPRSNELYFGSAATPVTPIGTGPVTSNRQMVPPPFSHNMMGVNNIGSHPNSRNTREFQQYQVANTHPAMLDYRSTNEQPSRFPRSSNLERHGYGRENHHFLQTPAAASGMNSQSIPRVAPSNPNTPSPRFFWHTPRPPQLISPRNPEQISSDTQQIHEADMLRKPSLYGVPPWPTPTSMGTSKQPADTNGRGILTQNPTYGHGMSNRQILTSQRDPTSEISSQSGSLNGETSRPRHDVISATTTGQSSPSENPRPQNPRKRKPLSHSPNLIVDIAETCQEVFPFALVAERHNKPIQKVFDAFAAIIQLPLLRNADDKRRHGSLGKRRMKEYRDARKAMALAREEELKARRDMLATGAEAQFGSGRRPGRNG
ncbi:hypothetical protein HYFRA_00010766 [Hymenoscyphus fraxineus]|uniref:Uncharacterized protein n=1 Tax=Hymenoscyphus fraxineus TaxID=746836 RepID=A0A9N9L083_9HELO|nr:hypothetical protein HYFRA_00010766 [Hymenoscyphus fraxineus]